MTRNRCPSMSRGAVRGLRAVRARDTHLFHAAEVDHHLLVRRLAHRRGLRRFRHRDPLASTIERRGPSLARSVRWLPCRSRRSRDTRSARFALCPTRRASSPFAFRDGCRSNNGQNETRRKRDFGLKARESKFLRDFFHRDSRSTPVAFAKQVGGARKTQRAANLRRRHSPTRVPTRGAEEPVSPPSRRPSPEVSGIGDGCSRVLPVAVGEVPAHHQGRDRR